VKFSFKRPRAAESVSAETKLIGVRGATWRAHVDAAGVVCPTDGSTTVSWQIAAADQWHDPSREPSTRQKWYAGTPVVETRVRVPGGDVAVRIFCVADLGGMTLWEFENESASPVVVGFSRSDVLTSVSSSPPIGTDLPSGSIAVPLGHRGTTRIGLLHSRPHTGRLPDDVPRAPAVVRGWETAADVPSRLVLPDHALSSRIVEIRTQLLLNDLSLDDRFQSDTGDVSPHLVIERMRLGETRDEWEIDVSRVAEDVVKSQRRRSQVSWDTPWLLTNIATVARRLGDELLADDVAAAMLRLADRDIEDVPSVSPDQTTSIAWAESILVRPSLAGGQCTLFPGGIPRAWWGQSFEWHRIAADATRTVSAAVRWHGARPALLWETSGPAGLVIDSAAAEPSWHTTLPSGETLLLEPVAVDDVAPN
jgi:hypothetical protein